MTGSLWDKFMTERDKAVDAFSRLCEGGCFVRSEAGRAVSLCDMHAKYAEVMEAADVLADFETIPLGPFDLPKICGAPAAA